MSPPASSSRPAFRSAIARVLLFAVLWWGLVEGEIRDVRAAAAAIGVGVVASFLLVPPLSSRVRWAGLARFVSYFIWQSLKAGTDVARRSFHPHLPIDPGFITYPLRLSREDERVFFTDALSLLPGTVGAELHRDSVLIHVLDRGMPVHDRLRELEDHVVDLFSRDRG